MVALLWLAFGGTQAVFRDGAPAAVDGSRTLSGPPFATSDWQVQGQSDPRADPTHLNSGSGISSLATARPLPQQRLDLTCELRPLSSENAGYGRVLRLGTSERTYWWVEFTAGAIGVYRTFQGKWDCVGAWGGLELDRWYRVHLVNYHDLVELQITDAETGATIGGGQYPHDPGPAGVLEIKCTASGGDNNMGMLLRSLTLTLPSVEPPQDTGLISLARVPQGFQILDVNGAGNRPAGECFGLELRAGFEGGLPHGLFALKSLPRDDGRSIPFSMPGSGRVVSCADEGSYSPAIPVGRACDQIFLLASARLPSGAYNLVHHFYAEIEYEDGRRERQFPQNVVDGEFLVRDWSDPEAAALKCWVVDRPAYSQAYCLKPAFARPIRSVRVYDNPEVFGDDFVVFAATATDRTLPDRMPGLASANRDPRTAIRDIVPDALWPGGKRPRLSGLDFVISDGTRIWRRKDFRLAPTTSPHRVTLKPTDPELQLRAEIEEREETETSDQQSAISNQQSAISSQQSAKDPRQETPDIGHLASGIRDPASLCLRLHLINDGAPRTLMVSFPVLDGIAAGIPDIHYVFPLHGGQFGSEPCDRQAWPRQGFPMQWLALWHEPSGAGLRLQVLDPDGRIKALRLLKRNDDGTVPERSIFWWPGYPYKAPTGFDPGPIFQGKTGCGMAVTYLEEPISTGGEWSSDWTVLEAHEGDWHYAFDRYRDWFDRTFTYPPTPQWWLKLGVSNSFWAFMGRDFHGPEGYNPDFARGAAELGGWAELWRWWSPKPIDPEQKRFQWIYNEDKKQVAHVEGDYTAYHENWGGHETFHKFVRDVQAMGVRMTLYVQGCFVSFNSTPYKEHGMDWGLLGPDGGDYEAWNEWFVCPFARGWQDDLARQMAQVVRDTGVDGIRLDSLGMDQPVCFNPRHEHRLQSTYRGGTSELVRRCREAVQAVNPEAILWTEGVGCDQTTEETNGYIGNASAIWGSSTPLDLFRHAARGTQCVEWIEVGTGREALQIERAAFNGSAVMQTGPEPTAAALAPKMAALFREHGLTFHHRGEPRGSTSSPPRAKSRGSQPGIPTLQPNLYASLWFGDDEVLVTLHNDSFRTLFGPLVEVELPSTGGATWREVFHGREIEVSSIISQRSAVSGQQNAVYDPRTANRDQRALISGQIEPKETLVIVCRLSGGSAAADGPPKNPHGVLSARSGPGCELLLSPFRALPLHTHGYANEIGGDAKSCFRPGFSQVFVNSRQKPFSLVQSVKY